MRSSRERAGRGVRVGLHHRERGRVRGVPAGHQLVGARASAAERLKPGGSQAGCYIRVLLVHSERITMSIAARTMARSLFIGVIAAAALVACGKKESAQSTAGEPAAEEKVLNLSIWNDYLADDTIANFQSETGIEVSVTNYGSNE